jgi:lipopolysaccharide export system permease protein
VTPFRRHDRYVLKAFWGAFGAILLFFTVIVMVIHMSDRLSRVVKYWGPIKERGYDPLAVVAEYYATLIPFIWMQIIPLATVLAAAFALSRLTRTNELSPLVTAGVSSRRITLPIVLSGVAIGVALFGVQELLVPALSRRNMALERLLNKSEPERITKVPHFDDPGGARLSVAAFRPLDHRLEGAMLTLRSPEGVLREIRTYPQLRWDDAGRWVAETDGTSFRLPEDRGPPQRSRIPAARSVPLEASLDLFEVSVLKEAALGLSAREAHALLEADPDNPRLSFLYHQLLSRALVPLVLLLVSLPYCLVFGRRSAIPGTIAALASSAIFYGFTFFTSSLSGAGTLNPVFLAWFPVINFGSIGLVLWLTMRS